MNNRILLTACLIGFCMFSAYGQKQPLKRFYFGPQLGIRGEAALLRTAVVDSVYITNYIQRSGYPFLSVYAEKPFNKYISLRAELTYLRSGEDFLVYDVVPHPGFGYVRKSILVGVNSIQLPIFVNLHLPGALRFVGVLGGVNSHLQFGEKRPDVTPNSSINEREAVVINALDESIRSYVPYWIIGVRLDVWRFTLLGRHEGNLNKNYFRAIKVGDQSFQLNSRKYYTYVTLSYKFYGLKRKKNNVYQPR